MLVQVLEVLGGNEMRMVVDKEFQDVTIVERKEVTVTCSIYGELSNERDLCPIHQVTQIRVSRW